MRSPILFRKFFVFVFCISAGIISISLPTLANHCGQHTWDGGGADSNWSTTENWDTDAVPGACDTVVFDNTNTEDSIIDAGFAGTISSLNINAGYTGTLTQANGADLTINNDFSQADGIFIGGTGTVDINGDFTLSGGVFTSPENMNLSAFLTKIGGIFDHNSGTLTLDGLDTVISSNDTFMLNHLTIDKDPGRGMDLWAEMRLVIEGNFIIEQTRWFLTYDNNNPNGLATVEIRGNLINETNGGATTGVTEDFDDTLEFTGTNNQIIDMSGSEDELRNIVVNKPNETVNVASDLTLTTLTITSGSLYVNGMSLIANGNLSVAANGNLILRGDEPAVTTPTLNAGSTATYGTGVDIGQNNTIRDWDYRNLVINAGFNDSYQLGAQETVAENFTIQNGTFSLNGFDLDISGNFNNNDRLVLHGTENLNKNDTDSGSVEYIGDGITSPIIILDFGNSDYNDLVLNQAATSFGMTNDLVVNDNFLLVAGTFDPAGSSVDILGDSQINAGATVEQTTNRFDTNVLDIFGTFNGSPLGINDLTVAGNITIRNGGTLVAPTAGITLFGNWSLENGGTFTPGVATVFLNNNNDQEFFGSTTFLNLFKGQGGPTTLTFPAGETQTITGTLVLGGENGNPITLTSSGPGTAALNAPGTVNLSFLNIQGIVAQPTLSCTTGCVDGGGNTNWIFTTPSSGSSSGRSMRRLSSPTIRAHISEAPMAVAESSQGRAASWEILPLPAESTTHAAAQEEAETQTLTNHPVPNPQTFTTPLLLVSQVIDLNHIPLALKKMYADTWYQEAGALFMYVQLQVVKSFFPDINPDILMGPDPLAAIPLRTFLEYLLTPSNQPVFLADSELLEQGQGFQLLPSTIRIDHFDQPIRRSQALVMTNRFIAHLSGVDLEEAMAKIEPANKYNDIPTDSPLVHHALFSALIGIFSGLNSDTFEPDRDLNYAEFFALLKNINTYLSARQ